MTHTNPVPEPGDFDDLDFEVESVDPASVAVTLPVALNEEQTEALAAYAARHDLDLTAALTKLVAIALADVHAPS